MRAPSNNFSEKLLNFFLEALTTTYRYATEQPKMKEMVDFICKERFDLVLLHRKTLITRIDTLLRDGVKSGEITLPKQD